MNTNIRCLLKACEAIGVETEILHPSGNLVRVDIGRPPVHFANWSTPINRHASARVCGDKEYTFHLLDGKIRTPRTFGFLDPAVQEQYRNYVRHPDYDSILECVRTELGYPAILKRNAGSCGSNVFRCDSEAQAFSALEAIFDRETRHYDYVALAQEWVPIEKEYRALFLDGALVLIYEKDVSEAQFTGNLSPLHWENAQAVSVRDAEIRAAAEEFARPIWQTFPLRYAGLDLALDSSGDWWLLEINSAPAFDIFVRHNGEDEVIDLYRLVLGKLQEEAD